MVKFYSNFYLQSNSLSNSLPTELGSMASLRYYFYLNSNHKLCADIPTEVSALSSSVSSWYLSTATLLGMPCGADSTHPALPTTLPTSETQAINFQSMSFTGTIPTEFGLLTGVTEVKLNR